MIHVTATVEKDVKAVASCGNEVNQSAQFHVYDSSVGVYDGQYVVTPSMVEQTLETEGKKMAHDVTVEALEAYEGSYEVIPSTNQQTLQTSGKTLTEDITVQAEEVYTGSYNVTPSTSQQTLATNGKTMTADVNVAGVPGYTGGYTVESSLTQDNYLYTNGKLMADNITVLKADLSDTTARASDVMPGKQFYGQDGLLATGTLEPLEYVQDLWSDTIMLNETDFDDWAASTTATAILATENLGTFVADMTNYTYIIKWKYRMDAAYKEGVTLKAIPIKQCIESWQVIYRRFNTLAQLTADTQPYNAVATQMTAPVEHYYNTSGTATVYLSATYGIYMTVVAATFSSTTSNTPTITYKRPTISTRCNSSYFATARKEYIDSANTTLKIKAELWRVKMSTAIPDVYKGVQDIFNNGI